MTEPTLSTLICCPRCGKSLETIRSVILRCPRCDAYYPIREGIPSFSDTTTYWGEEFDRNEMREINALARKEGWRVAVDHLVRPKSADRAEYIEASFRADWRFLFPLEKEWRVLDVGAGWGTLSCVFAEITNEVVALESAWERVRFIRSRVEQDSIPNILPLHGTLTAPPLPRSSFDLIALNGVLEWLGWSDTTRSVPRVQLDHLKTCFDLLKPGGWLYIGIENRYGISSWLGAMDHSYLKYTSLLPRSLAHLVTYLKRGHSYRTYTYSPIGYQRLLADAGFSEIHFFATLPTYSRPVYYWRANQGDALKRVANILLEEKPNTGSTKYKVVAALVNRVSGNLLGKIAPFLVPHLLVVARKETNDRVD